MSSSISSRSSSSFATRAPPRTRCCLWVQGRSYDVSNLCTVEVLQELDILETRKRAHRHLLSSTRHCRREEQLLYPSQDEWPDETDVDQVFMMSSQINLFRSMSKSIQEEEELWVMPPIEDDPVIPISDLMYASTIIEPPISFSQSYISREDHESNEGDNIYDDEEKAEDDMTEPQKGNDDDNNNSDEEKQKKKPVYDRPYIEIMPGIYCAMRGSEETWQAVLDKSTQRTHCRSCSLALECMNTVSMVLCPSCRMITQLEGGDGGIGMGVEASSSADRGTEHQSRLVRVTPTFPMEV